MDMGVEQTVQRLSAVVWKPDLTVCGLKSRSARREAGAWARRFIVLNAVSIGDTFV